MPRTNCLYTVAKTSYATSPDSWLEGTMMEGRLTVDQAKRQATFVVSFDNGDTATMRVESTGFQTHQWMLVVEDDEGSEEVGVFPSWRDALAAFSQEVAFLIVTQS